MILNGCKRAVKHPLPLVVPRIDFLSVNSLALTEIHRAIYIYGSQFRDYSVVTIGGFTCPSFYNTSVTLGFYVPPEITMAGTYPIKIYNTDYQPNEMGFPINTPLVSNSVPLKMTGIILSV